MNYSKNDLVTLLLHCPHERATVLYATCNAMRSEDHQIMVCNECGSRYTRDGRWIRPKLLEDLHRLARAGAELVDPARGPIESGGR